MKNFILKTKLEQRQARCETEKSFLDTKFTRPMFLNKPTISKINQSNTSNIFSCPPTPMENFLSKDTLRDNQHVPSQNSEKFVPSIMKTNRSIQIQTSVTKKTLLRRRSCCCKWCGGISDFEVKHQDIATQIENFHRFPNSKTELDYSPPQSRFKNKSNTKCLSRVNNSSNPDKWGSPHKKPRYKTFVDLDQANIKQRKRAVITNPRSQVNITPEPKEKSKELKGSIEEVDSPKPNQRSLHVLRDLSKPEQDDSVDLIIKGTKHKKTSSIRLGRKFSPSPGKAGKMDLSSSKIVLGETPSKEKILNSSILTSPIQWKSNFRRSKVIQRLLKNGDAYVPPSSDKMEKLSTPLSLISMMEKNQNNVCLKTETSWIDFIRSNDLHDYVVKKSNVRALNTKLPEDLNDLNDSISRNQTDLYAYISTKIQKSPAKKDLRSAPKMLKSILGAKDARILEIYTKTQNSTHLRQRSLKTTNFHLASNSVLDSDVMTVSHSRVGSIRPDMKLIKKEVDESNHSSSEIAISGNKRIRLKLKELQPLKATNDLSMAAKSSSAVSLSTAFQ